MEVGIDIWLQNRLHVNKDESLFTRKVYFGS